MNIFNKVFSSMLSQNFLGWIVIFLIVCIFAVGIITTIFIKKYYEELLEDLTLSIEEGQYFHNEELDKIVNEFSKSTTKGTDNINTEVIIDKNISKKIIKMEGISKMIPSTLIGLGLLGTFLGLTLAIFETKSALTGIENINTFSNALQNPIASMATAFWTSIFGVIGSLILNFINQSMIFHKDEFYNEIENYLDNEIFAKRAKTFNTIFEEFSVTVKTTMLTLTEEMTVLFKNGVEELVNKINANSLDLTNSAEALKDYIDKFKSLVKSMDNTVENFNKPVDNFSNSVIDFINISESLESKFGKSFHKFDNTVKSIDNTMLLLGTNVKSSVEILSDTVETLNNTIHKSSERVTEFIEKSNDNLSSSLNETLGEFSEVLTVNIKDINESFKNSMDEVALGMNTSFSELKITNNRNIEQLDKLGAIIRKEGTATEERADRLTELINTINKINEIRENENFEQMEMLKETFNDLKNMIENLKNSIGGMNDSISEQLAIALDKNLNEIARELSKDLSEEIGTVVSDISDSVSNLNESITIIGELVKASNDWASAVAYTLNESGSDKLI